MLTSRQLQAVHDSVAYHLGVAEAHMQRRFSPPEIFFDLRGKAAGQYRFRAERHQLRFNPDLFAAAFQLNLAETVPHEVAHYVASASFGRVRPHGKEWRTVMALFGVDPSVTHTQDVAGLSLRRERRWRYRCGCREHEITTRRHNRIVSGQGTYLCRFCGKKLNVCKTG